MSRATWVFAATSVVGVALAIWLYLDNRSLEEQLAAARAEKPAAAATEPMVAARAADPWTEPTRSTGSARTGTGPAPSLPAPKEESRLERRQRRQQEFAAMFGRLDGETEEEYRNRIVPMIKAITAVPIPTVIDTLAPYKTRVNRSRPSASVPIG